MYLIVRSVDSCFLLTNHLRSDQFCRICFPAQITNVLPGRRLRQTRLRFLMSVASPSSTGVGHQRVICVRECLPQPPCHLRESDSVNQTVLEKVRIFVRRAIASAALPITCLQRGSTRPFPGKSVTIEFHSELSFSQANKGGDWKLGSCPEQLNW